MRITDTMRQFLSSRGTEDVDQLHNRLATQWATATPGSLSATFCLLWGSAATSLFEGPEAACTSMIGIGGRFDSTRLELVDFGRFGSGALGRSFRSAVLVECELQNLDLRRSSFHDSWLESVSFIGADLRQLEFAGAALLDIDLTDAQLEATSFIGVEPGFSIRLGAEILHGERALGAVAALGAEVGDISSIYRVMAHDSYDIAQKVARKILEPGPSQVLGLTQRGASAKNPKEAQRFVNLLEAIGFVRADRAGAEKTVEDTPEGRRALKAFIEQTALAPEIEAFFLKKKEK